MTAIMSTYTLDIGKCPSYKNPLCNHNSCKADFLIPAVFSNLTSVFPESGSSNKSSYGSGTH